MSFITKPEMGFYNRKNWDQMIILKAHTQECSKSFKMTVKWGGRSFFDKVLVTILSTNQKV